MFTGQVSTIPDTRHIPIFKQCPHVVGFPQNKINLLATFFACYQASKYLCWFALATRSSNLSKDMLDNLSPIFGAVAARDPSNVMCPPPRPVWPSEGQTCKIYSQIPNCPDARQPETNAISLAYRK